MILLDKFNRPVELLQIAASASCQYNCSHCGAHRAPAWGNPDLFPTEDILCFVRVMAKIGLKRARISGGEPMLRPDIIDLISGLAEIDLLKSISMSTNGKLLEEKAGELAKSGLDKIFVTIPALDKTLFHSLTGANDLDLIIKGIDTLIKTDSMRVTVKMTILAGINDHEIMAMVKWCGEKKIDLYLVEGHSPVASGKITEQNIISELETCYSLTRMEGISHHNNPWKVEETGGLVKIITTGNKRNCGACNRFWLSTEGLVTMCSGVESTLDLKSVFEDDTSGMALEEFAVKVALNKPIGVKDCGPYPFPSPTTKTSG